LTQQALQTIYKPQLSTAINTLAQVITAKSKWNAEHFDEDCSDMNGLHHNELFYNCTFDNLNDLILSNCVLAGSKFTTDDIRDCLNFTLTLNCHSVRNVEYSELLFDMFLIMLDKTKGNDEKRKKILEIVGEEKADRIFKLISRLER
jgi:hypothetical protein